MGESCKKGCKNSEDKVQIIGQIVKKYNSPIYGTVGKTNVLQNNIRKSVAAPGIHVMDK